MRQSAGNEQGFVRQEAYFFPGKTEAGLSPNLDEKFGVKMKMCPGHPPYSASQRTGEMKLKAALPQTAQLRLQSFAEEANMIKIRHGSQSKIYPIYISFKP